MIGNELGSGDAVHAHAGTQYSSGTRSAERSGARSAISSRTLRLVYFTLAASWGFIAGVAGLLVALSAFGQPVVPSGGAVAALLPGLAIAAVGGRVLAGAYEEAKRRRR